MGEEPINLVLERLNGMDEKLGRLDGRIDRMTDDMRFMFGEMRAQKQPIAASLLTQSHSDAKLAAFEHRLDRIERRLELREEY
ncbi:hypothetical protein [Jannaschia formosa]|uniref:hypothetical protein n=1 Tax=Jannaschia formosa TaxID=2259592 RepID=UPI000E1BF78D|nr:hypothetical protein [Jannaschia formosa]TFL18583.1 hypothetical protein DR046_08895 [Jannaschia formosa]